MYQINTIIAAVQLALDAKEPAAVTAILKHYLMDDHYVPRDVRQDVLKGVNAHFDTKYSVTTIKKANPATLNGLKLNLPEKETLIPADKVQGSSEIPADMIAANPNATIVKETLIMQVVATPANENNTSATVEALDTAGAATPKGGKDKKPGKKDKTATAVSDTVELAKADGLRFAKAFATAFQKGKTKKGAHHMALSIVGNDLTPGRVAGVYDFFKPSIKVLIDVMSEIDGLRTKEEREETFDAWVHDDKDRSKSFKKFRKLVDGEVKKTDHIIGLYLLTTDDNLKNAVSLAVFATEAAAENDDTYAFIRKNQDGINPRWSSAIAAVAGGGIDMAMNGFNIGSAIGTAVGAGAAFIAGEMLEGIESPTLRSFTAGALGASFGIAGSRAGRFANDVVSGTEVEVHDGNIVATIPAQNVIAHTTVQQAEAQPKVGLLGGITDYLMG